MTSTMAPDDIRKLGRMGRRRFVETLSSLGISGTTLAYLSQETLAERTGDLEDEVPYVAYLASENPEAEFADADETGRAPIYRTIPHDEWAIDECAQDAATRLNQLLESELQDSKQVNAGVTTTVSGHRRKKVVTVNYTTVETRNGRRVSPSAEFDEVSALVPDTVTGQVGDGIEQIDREFDVKISERQIRKQSYYDCDYRPSVPAGCQVATVDFNEGSQYLGTTTTPAHRSSDAGDIVMVASGHVLDQSSNGTLYHPQYDDSYGSIDEYLVGDLFDAGIVPVSEYDYDIADDSCGSEGWPIDGIVTWDTIKHREGDSDYELTVQGRTSGRHQASIENTGTGSSSHEKMFSIDTSATKDGDSGGPHYRTLTDSYGNEWTYVAGVHVGLTSANNAAATAMEEVENYFDVVVDSS